MHDCDVLVNPSRCELGWDFACPGYGVSRDVEKHVAWLYFDII